MPDTKIARPSPGEYPPYYGTYVDKVADGDVLGVLRGQITSTLAEFSRVTEPQALYRYAPGKWSLKQVAGHMADTERIFAYRALCFARLEKQPLPGFDENAYVAAASFDQRPWAELLDELKVVRAASLALFTALTADELKRTGVANEKSLTVRAIPYIIAGHEKHHMGVVAERYLRNL